MLRALTKMQSELSSDARRALLNAVTDLFLLDDDPNPVSKEHYGAIAEHALEKLDSDDRQSYATQVAAVPTLPHAVAIRLASDEHADVARLVLKLSPVLTDHDLAAIAVSQSQNHLAAIAERARLSSSVTDILVARGDQTVLQAVSENSGAAFSDQGFETLLERGAPNPNVSSALARRTDLGPERAFRVLRIVEQVTETTNSGAPSETISDLARQARQQRFEVKVLISDIAAKTRTIDDVVHMLANQDRAYHLAQVIGASASQNTDQVLRVLMQPDITGIAIVCRVLNISKTTFSSVVALRARRMPLVEHDIAEQVSEYGRLDAGTADRALRFLKMKIAIA